MNSAAYPMIKYNGQFYLKATIESGKTNSLFYLFAALG